MKALLLMPVVLPLVALAVFYRRGMMFEREMREKYRQALEEATRSVGRWR